MRIFYLVDQFETVKSGPGLFVKNLQDLDEELNLNICFVSQDIEHKGSNKFKIPSFRSKGRFFTGLNVLLYSLTFLYIRIRHRRCRVYVNSFYLIYFTFWLRGFKLFVNDYRVLDEASWITKLNFKFQCILADMVIFNSPFSFQRVKRDVAINSFYVLHKSVSVVNTFNRQSKILNPLIITFCKNDWRYGNLPLVVEWLSTMEGDYLLRIIGVSNPSEEDLLETISPLISRNKVEVFGLVDNQRLLDLLSESTIFLNFCLTEAFGVASLEAVLSRNILITLNTESGLVSLMREYGFGRIVEGKEAFLETVNSILRGDFSVDELELNHRIVSSTFHPDNFKTDLFKLFDLTHVYKLSNL